MKRKQLAMLVPAAAIGLLPGLGHAASVDSEPANNLFSGADTWPWQSDAFNEGIVQNENDVDFFRLTGFVPGSQANVTFDLRYGDGPIRLEVFDTTQVDGNNIDLLAVLDSADLVGNAPQTDTLMVTVPANGELGFKVSFVDQVTSFSEGYRITIEAESASQPQPEPIPVAGWPLIPLIGAAALAGLRRRQQRPGLKRAA